MVNLASILNRYLKIFQNKLNRILLYKNVIITILLINHEKIRAVVVVVGLIAVFFVDFGRKSLRVPYQLMCCWVLFAVCLVTAPYARRTITLRG